MITRKTATTLVLGLNIALALLGTGVANAQMATRPAFIGNKFTEINNTTLKTTFTNVNTNTNTQTQNASGDS